MDKKTELKLAYLQGTKDEIKAALIEKGQTVADTDTFRSYADKVRAIGALIGTGSGSGSSGGSSGDSAGGNSDTLCITSFMTNVSQAYKASTTATATIEIPSAAIIFSVLGYTTGGSNSKTYPCPGGLVIGRNPTGVTLTETDDYKTYTLSHTYGSSSYYNTVIAELVIVYTVPGLLKRIDGNDVVLYCDSSLAGLSKAETDYGDFTKADFSLVPVAICDKFAYARSDVTSVVVNSACPSIGGSAFYQCTALTLVSDDESDAVGTISLPYVTTMGSSAFRECTKITTVSLPSLTSITGGNQFYKCSGLKTVSVPALTRLGSNMFYECTSLESVDVSSVTDVETSAFSNCSKLTEIVFSSDVNSLGYCCFKGCTNLVLIDLSHCTAVPLNGGIYDSGVVSNANLQIKIPSALYDEWIADGNWAPYADYIVAV